MATVELPSYLNAQYIAKALTKAYASEVQVLKCDIKLVSANGDNFCSDIYRVQVTFARQESAEHGIKNGAHEEKSLVLKVMLTEMAEKSNNECVMYEHVLPAMEEHMSKLQAGTRVRFNAGCLMVDRIKKEVYVLEDLNALGYSIADRWLGLDEAHSKILMHKLGQFHAASMVLADKSPAIVETLGAARLANSATDAVANAIVIGGMEHAAKLVATWPNFGEIATKMRALVGSFEKRIQALFDPATSKSKVCVLNHGDLWVNNFLYSYEDGQPKDVVFVDFQNCYMVSPGFDINYFLNTSIQLDVLKHKRYDLQRIYYSSLRNTLERSNYDARKLPTWQTIMQEIRNTELFGYYAAVCELPICCMSKLASQDMTVSSFTDRYTMALKRELLYGDERVVETLKYCLDRFNELGILD